MKPRNPVYVGGPPLDPLEYAALIHCKFCKKKFTRPLWQRNHWHCPGCHEEDAAWITEED
ncbi:MAG: hypothetical protein RR740_09085 [Pseudomonas sp.]